MKKLRSNKVKLFPLILSVCLTVSALSVATASTVYATEYTDKAITATNTYTDTTAMANATLQEENGVYSISNLTDLAALAALCTEANGYLAGKTVVLNADLDLTGVTAAIGTFAGKLDGNGKTVKNVTLDGSGLIGTLMGGAEICNLIIDGATVSSTTEANVGVLVGSANATSEIKITNVAVKNATVTGSASAAGGLVGALSGTAQLTLENCTVSGSVTGNLYTGGLVGYVSEATASISLTNCKNSATLAPIAAPTNNYYLGGMVAYSAKITADGCLNTGAVSDVNIAKHVSMGGIAGYGANGALSFTDCVNNGVLTVNNTASTGNNYNVAGIIGEITSTATATLNNCTNNGAIVNSNKTNTNGRSGGMCGLVNGNTTVENCNNLASIEASAWAGGMIADNRAVTSIKDCYNAGAISQELTTNSGYNFAGGIVAFSNTNSADKKITIENCINTGSITSVKGSAAGILSQVRNPFTIKNCINTGNVYSNIDSTTGTVSTSNDGNSRIGGIVGNVQYNNGKMTTGEVSSCMNLGNVMGSDCVGGIAGYVQPKTSMTIENCYNNADLTVGYNTGSIVGRVNGNNVTIKNCKAIGSLTYTYTSGINTGAITGCNTTAPTVTDTYAWVSITALGTTTDTAWVGSAVASDKTESDMITEMGVMDLGVQKSAVNSNGKFTALFIAGLNDTKYSATGFEVIRIEDGKAPSKTRTETSEKVFVTLNGYDENGAAAANTSTDLGAAYLTAMEIYNISAEKTVTYIYRPFVMDGDTVIYGVASTVTFEAQQ